jgi:hypothetical protein
MGEHSVGLVRILAVAEQRDVERGGLDEYRKWVLDAGEYAVDV